MDHIKDVLYFGGININPFHGTIKRELDIPVAKRTYKLEEYNPEETRYEENVILYYLKQEKVDVMKSTGLPSEVFGISGMGYLFISVPYFKEKEGSAERLVCLSHELGHYLDFKFNYNFDRDRYKVKDEDDLLNHEFTAWRMGFDILEALNFSEWDVFIDRMETAYKSYKFDEKLIKSEINKYREKVRTAA